MATNSQTGKRQLPAKAPYSLKRTVQRLEHGGQEYLVDVIVDEMNKGHKLSQAIKNCYPDVPAPTYSAIATKVKKHPYFVAYKEVSLKLISDKSAALQQNMLDLAFNSRSDMIKYSATKDSLDRIHGEAGKDNGAEKPLLVFNFSFGGNNQAPIKQVTIDPDSVPEAEVL
ncbi:MAG: hypothetical protein ACOH18_05555 [Candidatus Saccharimonadaceae bacterium]